MSDAGIFGDLGEYADMQEDGDGFSDSSIHTEKTVNSAPPSKAQSQKKTTSSGADSSIFGSSGVGAAPQKQGLSIVPTKKNAIKFVGAGLLIYGAYRLYKANY